jgi:hypothetical protein
MRGFMERKRVCRKSVRFNRTNKAKEMNLNEVLGTETKVIDLVSRHLDARGLL